MVGIYKITSPSGKIYIGQSIDILNRIYKHKTVKRHRNRLCHSFKKYGFSNHNIKILEECSVDELNDRERYWQDYYDACGVNGLNCWLTKSTTKSGYCHELVKEKISKAKMGCKSKLKGRVNTKHKGMTYNWPYTDNIVLDINTGVFYKSISEAAKYNNINIYTLRSYLLGTRKNKIKHLILTKNT